MNNSKDEGMTENVIPYNTTKKEVQGYEKKNDNSNAYNNDNSNNEWM